MHACTYVFLIFLNMWGGGYGVGYGGYLWYFVDALPTLAVTIEMVVLSIVFLPPFSSMIYYDDRYPNPYSWI